MSTPSFPMTQPVGSSGGFKTQKEYDSEWKNLTDLNQRMYGGQQPSGGSNPSSPYKAPSKAGDFSAYAPGRAQAAQPPSQGTPYGDWARPGPVSQSFGAPQEPSYSLQRQQSDMGNYGNTPDARPQSFTAQYLDYLGNPVSFEQQQAQRAALLQQVRQAELPFVFGNALNQDMGPPTLDARALLGNANKMVDDGFYNPFLRRLQRDPMEQLGQQATPSLYDPSPASYTPQPSSDWKALPPPAAARPVVPQEAPVQPSAPSLPVRARPTASNEYSWRVGSPVASSTREGPRSVLASDEFSWRVGSPFARNTQ